MILVFQNFIKICSSISRNRPDIDIQGGHPIHLAAGFPPPRIFRLGHRPICRRPYCHWRQKFLTKLVVRAHLSPRRTRRDQRFFSSRLQFIPWLNLVNAERQAPNEQALLQTLLNPQRTEPSAESRGGSTRFASRPWLHKWPRSSMSDIRAPLHSVFPGLQRAAYDHQRVHRPYST